MYYHPCVTPEALTHALKDFQGAEGYKVFLMEKIHRRRANQDDDVIYCSPQLVSSNLLSRRRLRQAFGAVSIWLDDEKGGDAQLWVCRVFAILLVLKPDNSSCIKLIVAYLNECKDVKTFLPYPVYNHGTATGGGVALHIVDTDDLEGPVYLVPIAGKGFEFGHHETRGDYWGGANIRQMYFYGIHPDRFEFLSDTATEQYYTELSADNKPADVPKTFLTIEQLQAFETLHKLDQPRKKETILYADEVKDEDEDEKSGVDMEAGVDLMIPVLDSDEDDSSYATEASSDTSDGDGSDGGDGDSDGSDEDSDGDGSDEGSDVDGSDEGSDVDGSDEGSDGDGSDGSGGR